MGSTLLARICLRLHTLNNSRCYLSLNACTKRNMSRLFEERDHAEKYAQFRPVYPPSVVERIVRYTKEKRPDLICALDVGCGSGQSSFELCSYFKHVVGTDISTAQIEQAKKSAEKNNFQAEFYVTGAEDLSQLPQRNVDLVTVAQAVHWIDTVRFYPEVKRILQPGGTLSLYGYGNLSLDNEHASAIVSKYYKETVGPYWDAARKHIDEHYAAFTPLPFDDFQRIDDIVMEKEMPLEAFMGYLTSWSAYRTYMKTNPGSRILEDLQTQLVAAYCPSHQGEELDSGIVLKVTWPIFILLGRKPM